MGVHSCTSSQAFILFFWGQHSCTSSQAFVLIFWELHFCSSSKTFILFFWEGGGHTLVLPTRPLFSSGGHTPALPARSSFSSFGGVHSCTSSLVFILFFCGVHPCTSSQALTLSFSLDALLHFQLCLYSLLLGAKLSHFQPSFHSHLLGGYTLALPGRFSFSFSGGTLFFFQVSLVCCILKSL